jgi:hypothetical protein
VYCGLFPLVLVGDFTNKNLEIEFFKGYPIVKARLQKRSFFGDTLHFIRRITLRRLPIGKGRQAYRANQTLSVDTQIFYSQVWTLDRAKTCFLLHY